MVARLADGVFAPAYPEIANSESSQELRIVNIAAIENHRIGQRVADAREIRTSEFMPLRHDCQRVGTVERVLGAVAKREVVPVAVDAPCLVHRHRIVGTHAGPVLPQCLHQYPGRGFAHIVSVGLEGQPPERDGFAAEIGTEMVTDLGVQQLLLPGVYRLDGIEELGDITHVARGSCQRLYVFRETGSAVPGSGVDKLITDPRIRAYPDTHFLD